MEGKTVQKQHLKTSIHHKSPSPEHSYILDSPLFVHCVFVLILIIYSKNKCTDKERSFIRNILGAQLQGFRQEIGQRMWNFNCKFPHLLCSLLRDQHPLTSHGNSMVTIRNINVCFINRDRHKEQTIIQGNECKSIQK